MQRFFVTVIIAAVLLGVMLYFVPKPYQQAVLSVVPDDAEISVYCRNGSADGVDLGFGSMVRCSVSALTETYGQCGIIDGVSATFCGDYGCVQRIMSKLRVNALTEWTYDGLTVISGYSSAVGGALTVDGKPVNCQIAYKNGVITIGFPLILGDY